MLCEAADLGFTHVELSHGTRITLVPGILRAVEEKVVAVSSTHNFCPLPAGVMQAAPNLFEPSRSEHREHDQWLRQTRRSIDFAAQVGARVLVTHLGSVRFFWRNPGKRLRAYLRQHPDIDVRQDPAYRRQLDAGLVRLRKSGAAEWRQVQSSLSKIRDYAVAKGVAIGCENREKFEELPVDADFGGLWADQPQPSPFRYWHDAGHAELKQRMGVLDHRSHLEANAAHLAGFHLHDVDTQGRDHCAIGQGTVDFEMVSTFWRPHHRLTLELGPQVERAGVRDSKAALEQLIAKRFP